MEIRNIRNHAQKLGWKRRKIISVGNIATELHFEPDFTLC